MSKHTPLPGIQSSEITPESLYHSRRNFLKGFASSLAGAGFLAACRSAGIPVSSPAASLPAGLGDELGFPLTPFMDVTGYNNYYEFSTAKNGIAELARNLVIDPWQVEVGGLVHRPHTYSVEDLVKRFPPEEHIYRMRCVEGWSMVIPWQGFQLSKLIAEVEPMTSARFVHFVTLHDPEQMPGQKSNAFPWPYDEGLRLDEAGHELTLLSTGLYGKSLEPQNGAPIRLVVPWKYGFKSIKAVVKIEFVEEQPHTFWNAIAPGEYGFYSNVTPDVDHPRWSQKTERRIGESGRINTLPFNGYAEQVAGLYAGMDLRINY